MANLGRGRLARWIAPLTLGCSVTTNPWQPELNDASAGTGGERPNGAAGDGGASGSSSGSGGGGGSDTASGDGEGDMDGGAGSGGEDAAARPAVTGYTTTLSECLPGATTFIDAIASDAWHDVALDPAGGMAALLGELERLRTEDLELPVRLRLAPGAYAATDVGSGEIYVKGLERSATAPVLVQAIDPTPNATRLGQGFNLVAVSYLAFDGLSIGPAEVGAFHGTVGQCEVPGSCYHDAPLPLAAQAGIHVSGSAERPSLSGLNDGHLDYAIYGRYRPAHHILVRGVTIQNIFGDDEPNGVGAAGGGSDGIKFNQASDVWVIDSHIRQTSRHGIDNVGVHGGCFQGNTIAEVGQGLGIEAKGGSIDVTYDGNTIIDVRRVELGGENTDATYYWSAEEPGSPEHYAYEGRRIVARNNVVIDAREGALEFSGCFECTAIENTILFRAGFDLGAGGGDAVREVDSHVNRDGAGSDCTPLDGESVDPCWGAGPYPIDLVALPGEDGESRALVNHDNALAGNLFINADGLWGPERSPYNHPNGTHVRAFTQVDYNYWFNGGQPLEDPNDGSWLTDGIHSVYTGPSANPDPELWGSVEGLDTASPTLALELGLVLRPAPGSPLIGNGSATVRAFAAIDHSGAARPLAPSIGAFEPLP